MAKRTVFRRGQAHALSSRRRGELDVDAHGWLSSMRRSGMLISATAKRRRSSRRRSGARSAARPLCSTARGQSLRQRRAVWETATPSSRRVREPSDRAERHRPEALRRSAVVGCACRAPPKLRRCPRQAPGDRAGCRRWLTCPRRSVRVSRRFRRRARRCQCRELPLQDHSVSDSSSLTPVVRSKPSSSSP